MKVLIINGSPRANGNTSIAVNEMVKIFEAEGVETVVSQIGNKDIGSVDFTVPGTCISRDPYFPILRLQVQILRRKMPGKQQRSPVLQRTYGVCP